MLKRRLSIIVPCSHHYRERRQLRLYLLPAFLKQSRVLLPLLDFPVSVPWSSGKTRSVGSLEQKQILPLSWGGVFFSQSRFSNSFPRGGFPLFRPPFSWGPESQVGKKQAVCQQVKAAPSFFCPARYYRFTFNINWVGKLPNQPKFSLRSPKNVAFTWRTCI